MTTPPLKRLLVVRSPVRLEALLWMASQTRPWFSSVAGNEGTFERHTPSRITSAISAAELDMCANIVLMSRRALDKAATQVHYVNQDGEVDPEDSGSQNSIYQVINEEESVEDVSITMMSVRGPDDPLIVDQLTSHKYMERSAEIRTADRWTTLSSEEKQTCFQAEGVDEIDHGKIPCTPRMQQLITRDTLVGGLKVPTDDCGSSVCLIPRRILLQLVAAKGDKFCFGRVFTTNLQIQGMANHLLSTGQQVVLHLDMGVTQAAIPFLIDERVEKIARRQIVDERKGPIKAPSSSRTSSTLKPQVHQSTSDTRKDGTDSSNPTQAQSSTGSFRPVNLPHPRLHSGPPPGLTRLRRNSLQAYWYPKGHQRLTPDDVAWYWRHKPGPPSKAALKGASRQLTPDLVSVQERCESTLDRIRFRPSFSRFQNRWFGPSPRVQVNPAQLSGTLVLPHCPFRESMVYKSCRPAEQRHRPSPGFLQTQIPGQTTKVWERGTSSQEPVMDKIPVDMTLQGSPKPWETVIGPVTRDGISPILLPQEGILPDASAILEEGILSTVTPIPNEESLPGTSSIKDGGILPDASARMDERIPPDATSITDKGILPDVLSIKDEGIIPDVTSIMDDGILLGETSMKDEGILSDVTPIPDEEILPDASSIKDKGILPDASSIMGEEILLDVPSIKGDGILLDAISVKDDGILPDVSSIMEDGILPDTISIKDGGILRDASSIMERDSTSALDSDPVSPWAGRTELFQRICEEQTKRSPTHRFFHDKDLPDQLIEGTLNQGLLRVRTPNRKAGQFLPPDSILEPWIPGSVHWEPEDMVFYKPTTRPRLSRLVAGPWHILGVVDGSVLMEWNHLKLWKIQRIGARLYRRVCHWLPDKDGWQVWNSCRYQPYSLFTEDHVLVEKYQRRYTMAQNLHRRAARAASAAPSERTTRS